jgi:hypothetical protein
MFDLIFKTKKNYSFFIFQKIQIESEFYFAFKLFFFHK